jgi:hypothetical protein
MMDQFERCQRVQWSFTIQDDNNGDIALPILSVVIKNKNVSYITYTKKEDGEILGFIRLLKPNTPVTLRKIISQNTVFVPAKHPHTLAMDIQLSKIFWEAGDVPSKLSWFLKQVGLVKLNIHDGLKLKELVEKFPVVCKPKSRAALIQRFIDEFEPTTSLVAVTVEKSFENVSIADDHVKWNACIRELPDKVLTAYQRGEAYEPSSYERQNLKYVEFDNPIFKDWLVRYNVSV